MEPTEMTPREWIMTAFYNEFEALRDGIMTLYNCREVEIDADFGIWIADPQRGHWLDDDGLARVARALEAGDI